MIRVLLVDDDPLVRSALSMMLGGQDGITVVGQAPDGAQGVRMAREQRPDVVLMDIRMPLLNGIDATAQLHSQPDPPRVLVLTTYQADDYVLDALAAGAAGFLLKDTPPEGIIDAIVKVASGEAVLAPTATLAVVEHVRSITGSSRTHSAVERLDSLTAREREVAIAVGHGKTNAEIASDLFLSVPTVKAHVSRLFEKLDVTNRVQIAMIVHDAGLV